MKKKIISILLIMLILFAVGCGKTEKSDNSKSNTKESTVEKKRKDNY